MVPHEEGIVDKNKEGRWIRQNIFETSFENSSFFFSLPHKI